MSQITPNNQKIHALNTAKEMVLMRFPKSLDKNISEEEKKKEKQFETRNL